MRLDTAKKLTFSNCAVCRYAGTQGVLWPQTYEIRPSQGNDNWQWELVITNVQRDSGSPQGGRRRWYVCQQHHKEMLENWIQIAQSEIDLDHQYNRWIDEVESERDLYD